MYEDRTLTCQEEGCGAEFIFDANDQEFFQEKGFDDPKRCKPCRIKKKQRHEQSSYGQS